MLASMVDGPPTGEDGEPQGLTGRVIRGVGLAGAGYIAAQAFNLAFYVVLARLILPAEFGEFAAGSLLVGVGLLVSESGIMAALVQRRDRIEEAASTATVSTFLSGILFGLLALAASPLIGSFFGSDQIGSIAAVMSGVIFLRTLSAVPDAMLQRRFSFLRRIIIEPISVVVFGIAAVIAASQDLGPWALVIGQYAAAFADVLLSWTLARWWPRLRLASYRMWRELVSYGRHVLAATIVLRIGEQSDSIWLGRFLGTAPLGQYRYAVRLASTPYWALVAGASYVLFPAFSRIATDPVRFESAFMRSLRWMAFAAFPAGFLLLGLGEPLAVVLFGSVWQPAGVATMAMFGYTAGGALSSIASEAVKAYGRPDLLTRMHALTTFLTAGLMGAMLPLGLNGVAAALSIGWSVSAVYAIQLLPKYVGFSSRAMWREIWPPAAAGLCMAAVLVPLEQLVFDAASRPWGEAAVMLAAEAIIGTLVFLGAMRTFAPGRCGSCPEGSRPCETAGRGRLPRRHHERASPSLQRRHPGVQRSADDLRRDPIGAAAERAGPRADRRRRRLRRRHGCGGTGGDRGRSPRTRDRAGQSGGRRGTEHRDRRGARRARQLPRQ